jgi:hypothetical protein
MRVLDSYHTLDRYHTASCYVQPADIDNADVLGSSLNSTSASRAQKQNGRVCSVLLSQLDPIATCTLEKREGVGRTRKKLRDRQAGEGGGCDRTVTDTAFVTRSI